MAELTPGPDSTGGGKKKEKLRMIYNTCNCCSLDIF
jgi:hypothetical protein